MKYKFTGKNLHTNTKEKPDNKVTKITNKQRTNKQKTTKNPNKQSEQDSKEATQHTPLQVDMLILRGVKYFPTGRLSGFTVHGDTTVHLRVVIVLHPRCC